MSNEYHGATLPPNWSWAEGADGWRYFHDRRGRVQFGFDPHFLPDPVSRAWRIYTSTPDPLRGERLEDIPRTCHPEFDGGCPWCGRDCPDAGKMDGCWYPDCRDFPHGA